MSTLVAAARRRLAGWPLRTRLLVTTLGLLAVVGLIVGVLSILALRGFLIGRLTA